MSVAAALSLGVLLLACPPVSAQTSAPAAVGPVDQQFLQTSAQDSVFQLACAELAVENSLSPDIQQLGMQIVQDHAQANIMLLSFAHDHSFSVPVTLSGADAKEIKTLSALHGSAFDLAYVKEVTITHAAAVDAADAEIADTLSAPVQTLVTAMRDTLRHHLSAANQVAQKLGAPTQKEVAPRTGIPIG